MNHGLQRLVGYALASYTNLIGRTLRVHIHGWDPIEALIDQQTPIVCAGYHSHTRLVTASARFVDIPDDKQICGIIAGDERQVILETFGRHIGYKTYAIGMDEDSFSAARELLRVLKDLRSGRTAYIFLAVDGPDGPVNVPKPGIAYLAQRAEATIVPIALKSPQAIILKSRWDQLAFPLPFSDVHIYFGTPFPITSDMQIDEILTKVSRSLEIANAQVESLAVR